MGLTKSRLKKEGKHARVYSKQVKTVAWRSLGGSAVKVWVALAMFEDGSNNGNIYFSDRKGAEMTGLSRNTVRNALAELIDRGFLYCSERGGFSRKTRHAATYGFTWLGGQPGSHNRAPAHSYEQWTDQSQNSRAQVLTETGAVSDVSDETRDAIGLDIAPKETEKWLDSMGSLVPGNEPQTVNQGMEVYRPCRKLETESFTLRTAALARLRAKLGEFLRNAQPGQQSNLARECGIPGGTLSKFKSGGNLPEPHVSALARHLG